MKSDLFPGLSVLEARNEMHGHCGTLPPIFGGESDRRRLRRLQEARQADRVFNAFVHLAERGTDLDTDDKAVRSVAAILFPWLLRFLFTNAMAALVRWLWMRSRYAPQ